MADTQNNYTANVLQAALNYAKASLPVFPCKPRGKAPLIEGGFRGASTDPEQITQWWRHWPDANIGIPTSGLVVIDLDDKTGGLDSFVVLANEDGLGQIPETRSCLTGGGGLHLLFTAPEGVVIRNSASVL